MTDVTTNTSADQPEHKPLKPLLTWIDASAALFGFEKRRIAKIYTMPKTALEIAVERATPQELDTAVKFIFGQLAQRIASHPRGAEALNQATDEYLRAPDLDRAPGDISLHKGCTCRHPGLRAWFLCITLPNSPARTRLLNIIIPPELSVGLAPSA